MLKKSLVLAAALAATISTYGQGSLVFNTQTTGQRITDPSGANAAGAAWFAQLYAGAAEGSLEAIGKAYNLRAGVNAGYVSVPAAEQSVVVPSATPGGLSYLQIKAWDSAYASYDLALAAGAASKGVGASKVWSQDTGAIAASPPEPPPGITGYEGFQLTIVPEPSVLALMGVGAAALLFRRRK